VDELLPQTRKLLTLVHAWVQQECEAQNVPQHEFQFTRRQAREAVGWGDTQMKIHLSRLAEMEFLMLHRGGPRQAFTYELLYQGDDAEGRAHLLGLLDAENLQPLATTASGRGEEAMRSEFGRGLVGVRSGGGRGAVGPVEANADGHVNGFHRAEPENAPTGILVPVLSYVNGGGR